MRTLQSNYSINAQVFGGSFADAGYSSHGNRRRITEMSDREYRVFKKNRKAAFLRRQVLLSLAGIMILMVLLSLIVKGFSSNAADPEKAGKCKYYKTEMLRFDKGVDEIAEEYFDPVFYSSVEELRDEIMDINNIGYDDEIPGGYIIYVPYYGDIH